MNAKKLKNFAVILAVTAGCAGGSGNGGEKPAKVDNPVPEAALTTITLTVQAVSRLGIEITEVARQNLARRRTYGGEIIGPSGRSPLITAPQAGMLWPAESGEFPSAGERVAKGQALCRLILLPNAQNFLGAREEVDIRKTELETARASLERARQLLTDEAGSQRRVEEAEAALAVAQAAYSSAVNRLNVLLGKAGDAGGQPAALVVRSPVNGVVRQVHGAKGQVMAAAAALVEVADLDPVWVRIALYVGDLAKIDPQQPALIWGMGGAEPAQKTQATPVAAPFSAESASASAALFYELPNRDGEFFPGQKVNAQVEWKTAEESLTIPYSAIIYDINGGTWVYESTSDSVFVRQRVEVDFISGDRAALRQGPPPGTKIVATGALELFGTEFWK